MIRALLVAGLAVAIPFPISLSAETCRSHGCPVAVSFSSVSAGRSYGLLIAAPDTGCHHVRFRVMGEASGFLGHTPPLAPGELAVVRMGRGFPEGVNRVTVASVGCDTRPAETRRVTLMKTSPDHGWRASAP